MLACWGYKPQQQHTELNKYKAQVAKKFEIMKNHSNIGYQIESKGKLPGYLIHKQQKRFWIHCKVFNS